jgi:dolichyl-phosphate-mannose--protein O-mannosyl transferase
MVSESLTAVSSFNLAVSVLAIGLVYFVSYALTADRIASVAAAGLLAVSTQHIVYSGYEFPMPVSVFLVGLEFFS